MARKRVSKRKRQKNLRISEKIEKVRHEEGLSGEQAAGMAYGMERSGRLKRHGVYKHVRKSRRRGKRN